MQQDKLKRSYFLFGLLFIYVIAQFVWWGNLLYRQAGDIAAMRNAQEGEAVLRQTRYMLYGEGAVFVTILIVLLILAFRSISKELSLVLRQKNFLLSVSHELKTPLSTSRTIIQTLLKRDLAAAQQKQFLETLLAENHRFSDLVNNVFLAQRLETGKFTVERKEENFSKFLEDHLYQWQEISAPNVTLTTNIEADIFLTFDPAAMETVMHNLLSNAQKYSEGNGTIEVALLRKEQACELQVSDNGIGIPKEEQDNIFKLFYRLENEETRKTKGTGLGLYLTHNIVKEHGGKITVNSIPGKGSTFVIRFKNPA